jgi:ParB family chromosome partitioning protein
VVPLSAKREVRAEAQRALNAMPIAWLPVTDLRESQAALNSRKAYDTAGLNDLAASIQEHGLLQPILVVPEDDQYRVVCGERRRRASIRAGLVEVPCVIKPHANEQTIFFWNIVENIQRVDLSPREKVAAIQQLADTGLGSAKSAAGPAFRRARSAAGCESPTNHRSWRRSRRVESTLGRRSTWLR